MSLICDKIFGVNIGSLIVLCKFLITVFSLFSFRVFIGQNELLFVWNITPHPAKFAASKQHPGLGIYTHTHRSTCVCSCVCVCVRAKCVQIV